MKAGIKIGLALVSGALLPAPALAQQIDWNAAKAAFEAGANGSETPDEREEYAGCTAFWSEWSDAAHAGRVPAVVGQTINPALVAPDSGSVALEWLYILIEPRAGETQAAAENEASAMLAAINPLATEKVEAALKGDAAAMRGVMGILGTCQAPPE